MITEFMKQTAFPGTELLGFVAYCPGCKARGGRPFGFTVSVRVLWRRCPMCGGKQIKLAHAIYSPTDRWLFQIRKD